MSKCFNSLSQEVNDFGIPICANIDCGTELKGFDITKKQRFCRKCRTKSKPLRWKCKGCGRIMTDSEFRPTRQYCNSCNGMPAVIY